MKLIIAKELSGAAVALTGGSVALLFDFYTLFGFCGFIFLWSLLSLVCCFFQSHRTPSKESQPEISDVAEAELPEIRTASQIIALNCSLNLYGETGFRDDYEMDTILPTNGVNTVIFLKPDTNLCNN